MIVLLLVGPPILIGIAALLLIPAAILPAGLRRVRETFRCPWTKRVVTADFLVPEGAAHPSDVAFCTAFPRPAEVTCKKGCRELAEARWGPSRGVFPRWALIADGVATHREGQV